MRYRAGSQVFYLHKKGYNITGSDFSPALIKQAKNSAKLEKQNIEFLDGDMRTLHVGMFDAVITMFNAIGHMLKHEFAKALANIHRNIKPSGLYLFDIFNFNAITNDVIDDFKMDIRTIYGNKTIHNQQHSEIDYEKNF